MSRVTPRVVGPMGSRVNAFGAATATSGTDLTTLGFHADTLSYNTRVEADGGSVENLAFVDRAIRHANEYGYWAQVECWVDPNFGVKRSGTSITDLYGLAGYDVAAPGSSPTWDDNAANGLALVTFDGTDRRLDGAAFDLAQPNTLIAVMSASAQTGDYLSSINASKRQNCGFSSVDGEYVAYAGNVLEANGAGAPDGFLHVLVNTFNGASSSIREDGVELASGDAGSENYGGVRIGANPAAAKFHTGDVGSALVLNGAITTTQRDAIEAFLMNEYGV